MGKQKSGEPIGEIPACCSAVGRRGALTGCQIGRQKGRSADGNRWWKGVSVIVNGYSDGGNAMLPRVISVEQSSCLK